MLDETTRRPLVAMLNFGRVTAESAATGDEEELAAFAEAIALLETYRDHVARAQHAAGKSWESIGSVFGITKQAAHKRWGKPVPLIEPWPERRAPGRDALGRFARKDDADAA